MIVVFRILDLLISPIMRIHFFLLYSSLFLNSIIVFLFCFESHGNLVAFARAHMPSALQIG